MAADTALNAAGEVARALVGGSIDAIERIRGVGRNSGVYRVSSGPATFALKQYPPRRAGDRDRALVEFNALRFLASHENAVVPRAIAADPAAGFLLLEWIDGAPVDAPGATDIDSACRFLRSIHALRDADGANAQPPAAEACLCGREIATQIERRVARLATLRSDEPSLGDFLDTRFLPLAKTIVAWARQGYAAAGLSFEGDVAEAARTLCPADFGFHNALRRRDRALVFIDFDYFGWDDPVKLTADFLLHPGMRLGDDLKRRFAAEAVNIYGADPGFHHRLALLYPLFALRWCAILLNEFLPERWVNRLNAGEEADWTAAKARQLERAQQWLDGVSAGYKRFPYGD